MAKKAVKRTVATRGTKKKIVKAVKPHTRTLSTRLRTSKRNAEQKVQPKPSTRTRSTKVRTSKRNAENKVQQSVRAQKKKLTTRKATTKLTTRSRRMAGRRKSMAKSTSRTSSAKKLSMKKSSSKQTSEEYEVEKICDIKFQDGEMYLVKWKGYAMKHNTWESRKNLGNATAAIDAFHSRHDYEVEKIIRSKMLEGKRQYRVRWRGWPASFDTWEPRAALMKGAKLEVLRFEKIQKKRKH